MWLRYGRPARAELIGAAAGQPPDVAGPHEVLAVATALLARGASGGYAFRIVAVEPGPAATDSGLGLVASEALRGDR